MNVEVVKRSRLKELRAWFAKKRSIALLLCVSISLMLCLFIGLKLVAGAAGREYAGRIEAERTVINERLIAVITASSKSGVESADSKKLQAVIGELAVWMRQEAGKTPPSLPDVPLGGELSEDYSKAKSDNSEEEKRILLRAVQNLADFGDYQQSLQAVYADPALFGTVRDSASAESLHKAWVRAGEQVKLMKTYNNQSLIAANLLMKSHIADTASYAGLLIEAYRENDIEAMKKGEEQLESRLAILRGDSELQDKAAQKLEVELRAATRPFL